MLLIDLLSSNSLGEIFVNNAGLMGPMYERYWEHYPKQIDVLSQLKQSKRFLEWEQEKRGHPDVQGLDMASFLILPVQRVPRYELLLQKLLQYTDEENREAAALKVIACVSCFVIDAARNINDFCLHNRMR